VTGANVTRRRDLPAPVTITEIYLLAVIERLEAIEARLARESQPATPPAQAPAPRRARRTRSGGAA